MLALNSTVAAQTAGPYRLNPGDTLRYREVTNMVATIQAPQGAVTYSTDQDATIALTGTGPGMAAAWYDALRVRSVGPNGEQSPGTDAALHQPFSLDFPADGRVQAKQVPTFPEAVTAITDLRHEFDDFFVKMPAKRPGIGTTWQDTVRSEGKTPTGGTASMQAIRKYRAEGDTVLAGVPAIVVRVSTTLEMRSSAPMPGRPMTMVARLAGEEHDVVLFDWARGRLLTRSKRGQLKGTFKVNGGAQPVELPETMTYTSKIMLKGAPGGT